MHNNVLTGLVFWPDVGEEPSPALARIWSQSVLGSVAQPDTCGVEPLQAGAIVVFRCQLNSVLSHAWLDILSCLDGLVNHL